MIRPRLGRYIRYWYTYRTVVAVLVALVLSGLTYWMYTQQLACAAKQGSCLVYLAGHPDDRLLSQTSPDEHVAIVAADHPTVHPIATVHVPRTRTHPLLLP